MWKPVEQGFTLLELLVTLVIAGLVLSLVTPRVSTVLVTAELKGEARKVASLMRHARSQAVLRNQETVIRLSEEPTALSIDDRDLLYRPPDHVRVELTAEDEATDALQTGLEEPAIRFFAAGGSSGGSILISLEDGQGATISVDPLSGRVHIDE